MDWHIDWTASIVVSVLATAAVNAVLWAFRKVRANDAYERGFDDGLHSALTKFAKLRYHKEMDVCMCIVPADEYRKELDQYL